MIHFGWPQWLFIAWTSLILVHTAAHDGEVREPPHDRYRFGLALIRVALMVLLLCWGGFFG
jgi:hypothetical protein